MKEVTKMAKEIRTAEATWLDLSKPDKFQKFFGEYLKLLKKKLPQIEVKGKFDYKYFTCGQVHDSRNPDWKPWRYLEWYCGRLGYDDFEVRDILFERIGRQVVCECQFINDDKEIRRKELEAIYGVGQRTEGKEQGHILNIKYSDSTFNI